MLVKGEGPHCAPACGWVFEQSRRPFLFPPPLLWLRVVTALILREAQGWLGVINSDPSSCACSRRVASGAALTS